MSASTKNGGGPVGSGSEGCWRIPGTLTCSKSQGGAVSGGKGGGDHGKDHSISLAPSLTSSSATVIALSSRYASTLNPTNQLTSLLTTTTAITPGSTLIFTPPTSSHRTIRVKTIPLPPSENSNQSGHTSMSSTTTPVSFSKAASSLSIPETGNIFMSSMSSSVSSKEPLSTVPPLNTSTASRPAASTVGKELIGGIVGAVAFVVIAIIVMTLFLYRRWCRRRAPSAEAVDPFLVPSREQPTQQLRRLWQQHFTKAVPTPECSYPLHTRNLPSRPGIFPLDSPPAYTQ